MTGTTLDVDTKQSIFRRLQTTERLLWKATVASISDENDHSARLQQERAFLETRASARRTIGREFDLSERQLRELDIEGVLQGWPGGQT